jgi:hypothetical protein
VGVVVLFETAFICDEFDQRFPLSLEETQMRMFACRVFVLYLGLAGTAVAEGGAGTGLSRSALLTFRPHHYHHHHYHHHYVQHLERKIVARVAKADHHHLRPSGYAEELTPRNISFEMSITQMPINKTYALAPGAPLLGLDPRSPSTWELYSEMLPFVFSKAPAASD